MSKHATPSSDTRPEEKRGKGLIWQVVLMNSSALILLTGVSLQRDLTPQTHACPDRAYTTAGERCSVDGTAHSPGATENEPVVEAGILFRSRSARRH